jgi:hypothetical protein
MSSQVDVYIRDANEEKGHLLGSFPFYALEALPRKVAQLGVYVGGNSYAGGSPATQFVCEDGRVYFEVIFG